MLSKNKIKYIRSLEWKKFRDETGIFVAEGNKLVADLLPAFDCEWLLARPSWIAAQPALHVGELVEAGEEEIRKASFLKNPQDVLALFKRPHWELSQVDPSQQLVIALDGIQDPGNLGTIIRLADWFGIRDVVCSLDTADAFSPKTIQATMGAIARVRVHYTDLTAYCGQQAARQVPLYGTLLDGENLYEKPLSSHGLLIMGNEGNGIRPAIRALVNERLYIPSFPPGEQTSESLNVAIATAVVCAEFRRRQSVGRQ
ncbi:MAG: RNA methyltransferase [Parabacteroides sp.]